MRFLYLVIFVIINSSCNIGPSIQNELIYNSYTEIVLSTCSESVGDYEFTTSNTYYYDLSNDLVKVFVFVSEFTCGYSSGTCGQSIEVYVKNGPFYDIAYSACGFNVTKLEELNFGVHSFAIKVRNYPNGVDLEYSKKKVSWDGSEFREMPLLDICI